MTQIQVSVVALLACAAAPTAVGLLVHVAKRIAKLCSRKQGRKGESRPRRPGAPEPLSIVRARCEAGWLLEELQDALVNGSASAVRRVQHMMDMGYGKGQDLESRKQFTEQAWGLHHQAVPSEEVQPLAKTGSKQRSTKNCTSSAAIVAGVAMAGTSFAACHRTDSTDSLVMQGGDAGTAAEAMQTLHLSESGLGEGQIEVAWWKAEREWGSEGGDDEPVPDDPDESHDEEDEGGQYEHDW